ncbi:carbonic anhydrase [Amycolatopsis lurida]
MPACSSRCARPARRADIAPAQHPFAVLFGCADSRLAAEIFDRGLGDLFVVRTAGHVAGPEVLGSVEYAVSALNCPLIVVLGHSSCGVIAATRAYLTGGLDTSGFVRDVIERVTPSVLAAHSAGTPTTTASSPSTSGTPPKSSSAAPGCSPTGSPRDSSPSAACPTAWPTVPPAWSPHTA